MTLEKVFLDKKNTNPVPKHITYYIATPYQFINYPGVSKYLTVVSNFLTLAGLFLTDALYWILAGRAPTAGPNNRQGHQPNRQYRQQECP